MASLNENTPVAGQGNEGEGMQMSNHTSTDQPTVLRMHQRGRDTGIAYGTEAGDKLPHGEWWPVLIPLTALLDAARGPISVVISPEDIKAQSAAVRARRRQQEISRRVRQRMGDLEAQIRAEIEAEEDNQ